MNNCVLQKFMCGNSVVLHCTEIIKVSKILALNSMDINGVDLIERMPTLAKNGQRLYSKDHLIFQGKSRDHIVKK